MYAYRLTTHTHYNTHVSGRGRMYVAATTSHRHRNIGHTPQWHWLACASAININIIIGPCLSETGVWYAVRACVRAFDAMHSTPSSSGVGVAHMCCVQHQWSSDYNSILFFVYVGNSRRGQIIMPHILISAIGEGENAAFLHSPTTKNRHKLISMRYVSVATRTASITHNTTRQCICYNGALNNYACMYEHTNVQHTMYESWLGEWLEMYNVRALSG